MKRYCLGIFFILLVSVTVIPAFFFYATNNLMYTDMFTRPGWLYGLALLTSIIAAGICEMRSDWEHKLL
jgi:hypothetical protein